MASAASVRDAILIGAVLAAGVLLVFLRSLKVTLIAVVVVPTVLAMTVLLLSLLNMSFNVMTLGGMAAAVGLIIDDAIVMTEHIVRRLRERRDAPATADRVRHAATEFLRPLAGSSAATLVIFAPLAFLTGVTGAFFKALSITMAGGLFISFVVTAVGVPLLADLFLGEKEARHEEGGRLSRRLQTGYGRLMTRLLARPAWVFVAVIPLALLGGFAFTQVGSGFMPAIDEGGFVLDYRSAPGTALSETDRLLRQVEAIIRATPDVRTFSRRTGTGLGGGLSEANSGDFFIRLKATGRRPVDVVMEEIRGKVEHAGARPVGGDGAADGGPDRRPHGGAAAGRGQAVLRQPGAAREARRPTSPRGSRRCPASWTSATASTPPATRWCMHIDRAKAALEGVDPATVAQAMTDALTGNVATQMLVGVKTVGVRVDAAAG